MPVPQFFTDFYEGVDTAVELFTVVACRNLHPDTSLSFGHYRIIESRDIDTLVKQAVGIDLRQFCIV